jgi:hypothetical protein
MGPSQESGGGVMRTYVTKTQQQATILRFKQALGHSERTINLTEQFWSFGHCDITEPETLWTLSIFLTAEEDAIAKENGIKRFQDTTFELVYHQAVEYMKILQKEVMKNGNPEQ